MNNLFSPLSISLFTYSTKPRGSVIHTLELAEALTTLGQEVWVYALSKDNQPFDRPLSCHTYLIPAAPAPDSIDDVIQQRIQEFVQYLSQGLLPVHHIYHAQDCLSANALLQLRQKKLIPHFIRTVHHIENYSSIYLKQCQDRSIQEANLCFSVSDHCQFEVKEKYGIHAHRITNGINLNYFTPVSNSLKSCLKQRLELSGSPIYLTVGGIEPRKNSLTLLKAFSLVKQEFPYAQMIIAGGASVFDYHTYRDQFFALAEDLQISIGKALILSGVLPREDLYRLYQVADAFVFPSTKEGWGLVILEAIASELPVITSNCSPFTEFLQPHQALMVDPYSAVDLARAMKAVLEPECRSLLVEKSRSILAMYTWDKSARKQLHYYHNLLFSHA